MSSSEGSPDVLILGIGNLLMGDEGVGVHAVRFLEKLDWPPGVECLDGGTGGFHLLGPMQSAGQVILIDATLDGSTPGSFERLSPKFSSDYPRTLTAHDIGLKDLLDAFYLLGDPRPVTLFAVSVIDIEQPSMTLSETVEERLPELCEAVRRAALNALSASNRG